MVAKKVKPLVLVADDDAEILECMSLLLREREHRVACAVDKSELLRLLEIEEPSLLLLDLNFGEHNGIEVMRELRARHPQLPVVLLTGGGTIDSAVSAIKLGAYDYLTKPADLKRIEVIISHLAEKEQLGQRIKNLEEWSEPANAARQIWGDSPSVIQLRTAISSLAPTDATVLIMGESGTGKELVAQALHQQSRRQNAAFVPLNMAALPRELVDSTLFGHERGAFTGADQLQIGSCEAADQGTLFLDEIGEMGLEVQAKLLRFLQERTFCRVGSSKIQTVNVRVVAATNHVLAERVRLGLFREDLYYRLNVVPLLVPPLRERRSDIALLATRFLKRAAVRHQKEVFRFTPAALAILTQYAWPGNIRQLKNLVERLVILTSAKEILPDEIPAEVCELGPRTANSPITIALPDRGGLSIKHIERQAIVDALQRTGGNVGGAAHVLGMSQATLYRKVKRYQIAIRIASASSAVDPVHFPVGSA